MALAPGTRLGPYEVIAQIGAGGMGEVYRARDTKLNRDVALKILPETFALEGDRIARFRREAQVLASFNHPRIANIYGFEDSASTHALVLELVEGPTLADRITNGPIPLDEALPIARQIAEALEAAHEQGIIHRDLKPANVKVRDDGTVKVLDFGLAKALEPASTINPGLSVAPTITTPAQMTGVGMILGTAAYMSPEQAKGKPADKRSDVWAFGCVLYEMLTGQRAFAGDDVADTLASVLKTEPAWEALPRALPMPITRLLRRCLSKDRGQRLGDVTVARLEIDEATSHVADGPVAVSRSSFGWKVATATLALLTIVALAWRGSARPPRLPSAQFLVFPPPNNTLTTGGRDIASGAVSPDGERVAFTARDNAGTQLLFVRPIGALTAEPLPGTEGAAAPFWSPDSRFIAYSIGGSPGRLLKVLATGGTPEVICTYLGTPLGTWNTDGILVVGGDRLQRIPAGGGQPTPLWPRSKQLGVQQSGPSFLPDGRHVVFFQYSRTGTDQGELYVGSIDGEGPTRLTVADSPAAYDPKSGQLLFVRQSTLYAQPFDLNGFRLTGDPVAVTSHVATSGLNRWARTFSLSETGTLVYGVGGDTKDGPLQLNWIDQHGTMVGTLGPPADYRGVELSPDGTRVAAHVHTPQGGDIWTIDTSSGTASRRTFNPTRENSLPVWSPDGRSLAFASQSGEGTSRRFVIRKVAANGVGTEEELVPGTDRPLMPNSWTSNALIYQQLDSRTRTDLWLLPLTPASHATELVRSAAEDGGGQVSPDGRWFVYHSNESGRFEVYVRPFPKGAGKWQVSVSGGVYPRWQRDGRALFFMLSQTGRAVIKANVKSSGGAFESEKPEVLFDTNVIIRDHASSAGFYWPWAVAPDGRRFLIVAPANAIEQSALAVVMNWTEASSNGTR